MVECRLLQERQDSASALQTIFALFPISVKSIQRVSICLLFVHNTSWHEIVFSSLICSICASSCGDLITAPWTFMTTKLQCCHSPLASPAEAKCHWLWFGQHTAGNAFTGWNWCDTFTLPHISPILRKSILQGWIFSYPFNPSGIS